MSFKDNLRKERSRNKLSQEGLAESELIETIERKLGNTGH